MRRVLIVNSKAGSGRRSGKLREVEGVLRGAGELVRLDIGKTSDFQRRLDEAVPGAAGLFVAGGDGTVNHSLGPCLRHNVPLCHLPAGTENLFAREFGSSLSGEFVSRVLAGGRVRRVDVGLASSPGQDDRLFAIMWSAGPDASVIHRLHATRRGTISHASYLRPALAEAFSPWLPQITLESEGTTLVHAQRGMLVIANSHHYGGRFDPAPDARVDDALLDAVFMPATSGLGISRWLADAWLGGRHLRRRGIVVVRAPRFSIRLEDPRGVYQVDGEAASGTPPLAAEVRVLPRALGVLTL